MAPLRLALAFVLLWAGQIALGDKCPKDARFNGCHTSGCIRVPGLRRAAVKVCNSCGHGYELVNKGTRQAACECAPGFAANGNNGLCKKCPEGTQIALGGPLALSLCLNCPKGTIFSEEYQDCLCSAGTYKTLTPTQAPGFKHVACKSCRGRAAYIDEDMHDRRTCMTCPAPQVANANHSACVSPDDPDAAPDTAEPSRLGSLIQGIVNATRAGSTSTIPSSAKVQQSVVGTASISGSPGSIHGVQTSSLRPTAAPGGASSTRAPKSSVKWDMRTVGKVLGMMSKLQTLGGSAVSPKQT